jgi:hypothetical protein
MLQELLSTEIAPIGSTHYDACRLCLTKILYALAAAIVHRNREAHACGRAA